MSRQRRIPSSNAMVDRIRGLDDQALSSLVTDLRFNTRLEQSVLAKALAEQRRRRRKAKSEATAS